MNGGILPKVKFLNLVSGLLGGLSYKSVYLFVSRNIFHDAYRRSCFGTVCIKTSSFVWMKFAEAFAYEFF